MTSEQAAATKRLQTALELTELAEQMLRHRLRRDQPHLSDEQIEDRIERWYRTRPGAEHGDAEGSPVAWPR